MASTRRWWLLPLALLFVFAWGPALFGPFHFDDDLVIVDYPPVHALAAWFDSLPGLRPLLKLSYALNWRMDSGPFGFHLVNLAIHVLNGALALRWLQRVLPSAMRAAAPWIVLLWLFHPVTTEAVTYVSGRSVSLAATFTLAALLASAGDGRSAPWRAALFTALALAVRETAWALPAALLLVEWLRGGDGRAAWSRAWPSLLVVVIAAGLFLVEPHHQRLLTIAVEARDPLSQAWTQVEAYRWFFGQAFLIEAPNFDPDLRVQHAPTASLLVVAMLLVALISGALWRAGRARDWMAGGLLLFFLFLLPGNGVVPRLDVANDRHLYLPLLGMIVAMACLVRPLPGRTVQEAESRRAFAAGPLALTLLVLVFAGATWLRNLDYLDDVALWQRTAAQSPQKSRVWNNLGTACRDAGDVVCASFAYQRAVALDPGNIRARSNLYFLTR